MSTDSGPDTLNVKGTFADDAFVVSKTAVQLGTWSVNYSGLNVSVSVLQSGATDQQVLAGIAGSDEFFASL